jgi:putative flippase GtrA
MGISFNLSALGPSAPCFAKREQENAPKNSLANRSILVAFIRFALLSGGGWLLDLVILVVLSRIFDLPLFLSNMASSVLAASMVFLLSRKRIHHGVDKAVALRLFAYVGYTILMIGVASAAMAALVEVLGRWPVLADRNALDVVVAKIAITPPQLILNFIVSRFISAPARRAGERD